MNYKYENQTAEVLLKQLKSASTADGLEAAVKQCISAASNENDPAIQKILLKVKHNSQVSPKQFSFHLQSAIFGRSFLYVNLNNPRTSIRPSVTLINESCTTVISQLRLVNQLQHINVSIPITYIQLRSNAFFSSCK